MRQNAFVLEQSGDKGLFVLKAVHEKDRVPAALGGQYFDTGSKVALLKAALHFAKKEGLM